MTTDVASSVSLPTLPDTLRRWRASRPIPQRAAALYLAAQPFDRMADYWPDREVLRGRVKAAFDDFIENGRPAYGMFSESGGRTGVAQMKIMSPDPGIRLFGAFVHAACFVGLQLFHRDELPFRPTGQKGRIDYKTLNAALVQQWTTLMPTIRRIRIRDL